MIDAPVSAFASCMTATNASSETSPRATFLSMRIPLVAKREDPATLVGHGVDGFCTDIDITNTAALSRDKSDKFAGGMPGRAVSIPAGVGIIRVNSRRR